MVSVTKMYLFLKALERSFAGASNAQHFNWWQTDVLGKLAFSPIRFRKYVVK